MAAPWYLSWPTVYPTAVPLHEPPQVNHNHSHDNHCRQTVHAHLSVAVGVDDDPVLTQLLLDQNHLLSALWVMGACTLSNAIDCK